MTDAQTMGKANNNTAQFLLVHEVARLDFAARRKQAEIDKMQKEIDSLKGYRDLDQAHSLCICCTLRDLFGMEDPHAEAAKLGEVWQ